VPDSQIDIKNINSGYYVHFLDIPLIAEVQVLTELFCGHVLRLLYPPHFLRAFW
jgi:hypothetical protein